MSRWTVALAGSLTLQACIPHLESQVSDLTSGDWVRPENTWGSLADPGPPPALTGQGYGEGDIVPDLRLPDQHGDLVSLWQFYGSTIVLDVSTMWCVPCQHLGEVTQATQDEYADEGLVYITILQQDLYTQPPTAEDIDLWVSGYEITSSPVLADAEEPPASADAILVGFPAVFIVDAEMRVVERVDPPDHATLTAAIEAAL